MEAGRGEKHKHIPLEHEEMRFSIAEENMQIYTEMNTTHKIVSNDIAQAHV